MLLILGKYKLIVMVSLLNTISLFVILIFSIFSIVLLKKKKTQLYSENKLFAIYLMLNIALIIISLLNRNHVIDLTEHFFFYFTIASLYFLLGPILYLYLVQSTNFKKQFSAIDMVHLSVFWGAIVYLNADYLWRLNGANVDQQDYLFSTTSLHIYIASLNIQIFIYLLLTIKTIKKYIESFKQNYSENSKIRISWFILILVVFTTHWLLDMLTSYSYIWFTSMGELLETLSLTTLLVFASIIVYRGLQNDAVFFHTFNGKKYIGSSITEIEKEEYKNRLSEFMEKNKPYLSAKLTLNELAESIDISPRHLSQIVNESYNSNFFDYINSYRINEAKSKLELLNDNNKQTTILEILFKVGFNSKTAFNRAFKKHIGITPTEFRKRQVA